MLTFNAIDDYYHNERDYVMAMAEALREQTKALSTLSTHQNRLARTFEPDRDSRRVRGGYEPVQYKVRSL